jgi:hypothetical protein
MRHSDIRGASLVVLLAASCATQSVDRARYNTSVRLIREHKCDDAATELQQVYAGHDNAASSAAALRLGELYQDGCVNGDGTRIQRNNDIARMWYHRSSDPVAAVWEARMDANYVPATAPVNPHVPQGPSVASVPSSTSVGYYEVCGMSWRNISERIEYSSISPVLAFDGLPEHSHCTAFRNWVFRNHPEMPSSDASSSSNYGQTKMLRDGGIGPGSFNDKMEAERNRQQVINNTRSKITGYGSPWKVEELNFTPVD